MLPTVRRVVASSAAAPPAAAAAAAAAFVWSSSSAFSGQIQLSQPVRTTHQQQRRYSSSKPSSPDNGSKALPGVPSNSSSSTSTSSSSSKSASSSSSSSSSSPPKSSSPKRKRKAKDTNAAAVAGSGSGSGSAAPASSKSSSGSSSGSANAATRAPAVKQKLPSVPSTQHLPMESVALSSFFSQHRPISITHSLPKIITEDAFATIFAPRASSGRGKTSEVIRTLSRAVGDLEGPLAALSVQENGSQAPAPAKARRQSKESVAHARHQLQLQLEEDAAAAAAAEESQLDKSASKFAGGSDADYYLPVNGMSDAYLPFHPPPPPVPEMTEAQAAEAAAEAEVEAESAAALDAAERRTNYMTAAVDVMFNPAEAGTPGSSRIFKAVLTFEEKTDENGEIELVTHTPQILNEGTSAASAAYADGAEEVPRSFFERMALRQLRFDDARQHRRMVRQLQRYQLPSALANAPTMLAISVKRQRKLKMKKKKYKKLMKRTRTLRRKLDRT